MTPSEEFYLILRTREKVSSEPVEIITTVTTIAARKLVDWLSYKFKGYTERVETYQNLFRFLKNCEFFAGPRYPDREERLVKHDLIAIKEVVDSIPGIFRKPKIIEEGGTKSCRL